MKRLFLMILSAAAVCLTASACYKSLPPLCYQQIYSLNGIRTEADRMYDKGTAVPVPEFKTELSKLFEAYPEALPANMKADSYRLGWYFRQHDLVRYTGDGIGDLCNHCAWFVLNCIPEKDRKDYTAKIAKMLLDFDDEGASKLLESLRANAVPGYRIVQAATYYDKDMPDSFKTISEICAGTVNGHKNPKHGLYRTFHPSGMLAMEVFYNGDTPVGYAFCYTPEGRIKAIYRYDKGVRTQVFGEEMPQTKKAD